MNRFIQMILFCMVILLLSSCSGEWAGCKNSSEKKVSPSGNLELVIKSKDCGATTSEVKMVYIVKKNQELSFLTSALLSVDKFENLDIVWSSEDQITISYTKANIHEFKNQWLSIEDGNIAYNVELIIVKK